MINLARLIDPGHVAMLHDWLKESGELYVCFEFHHSGGSGDRYLIYSLPELRQLLEGITWAGVEIMIYGRLQFPVRGTANNALLEQALANIPNGSSYSIYSIPPRFPRPHDWLGGGESHAELRKDFGDIHGESVAVGTDPPDVHELSSKRWFYEHHNEGLRFRVSMSAKAQMAFVDNPETYAGALAEWQEGANKRIDTYFRKPRTRLPEAGHS